MVTTTCISRLFLHGTCCPELPSELLYHTWFQRYGCSNFSPFLACQTLSQPWLMFAGRNKIPNLSNVVTSGPNARLEGVGSSGRTGGLLQKPALPPGKVGWRKSGYTLSSHNSWTRRPKNTTSALVFSWFCGACRQLNFTHIRAILNKFVYYRQRSATTTHITKNELILDHFGGLFYQQVCMLSTNVCFD